QPDPPGGAAMIGSAAVRRLVALALPAAMLLAAAGGHAMAPMPRPTTGPTMTPTTGPLCAAGQICTMAGTGIAGDGADELPALETRPYLPPDTTFRADGRPHVRHTD